MTPIFSDEIKLPDFLTISQIVKIKYPDPETAAEKEDYLRGTALTKKRDKLTVNLEKACRAGDLEFEGDFKHVVNEIQPYIVPTSGKFYVTPPSPPKEPQTYTKLIPSTIKIHNTKFKKFVDGDKKWFPEGFWRELINLWVVKELVAENDAGTAKYELYKNSLDALVKNTDMNLKVLKVETIFHQVQQTDKELWDIGFSTFKREVWPKYSGTNNLKRQIGRPKKYKK